MKTFVVSIQSIRDGIAFVETESEDEAKTKMEEEDFYLHHVEWFEETIEAYDAEQIDDDVASSAESPALIEPEHQDQTPPV